MKKKGKLDTSEKEVELSNVNLDTAEKEEEKICNSLANGLTTVIVDNPWLLPYLQKHIGEKNGNNV